MYKPAVFCSGHVESGCHHGDAYSKLTSEEKEAFDLLVSGHVNEDGSFTTEMKHTTKTILAVRHAESQYNVHLTSHLDSDLTNNGEHQAHLMSDHFKLFNLEGFVGYTSPLLRCVKTARYIQRKTGMNFTVLPELCEVSWGFPENGIDIKCMSDVYWEMNWNDLHNQDTIHLPKETDTTFVEKLTNLLDSLPEKTVIVSHGTCVMTLIELALGAKVEKIPEWDGSIKNASISRISYGTLEYMSKVVY